MTAKDWGIAIVLLIVGILIGYLAVGPSKTVTTTVTQTSVSTVTVTQTAGAPPPKTTTTQTTPTKKYADTIVIGVTDKVSDLDPANAYDFYTWEVFNNVGEGPFKYKPGTTDLTKGIIEDYEVKEGGKVYILKLRKDLKFADGTPCTAKDLKWSIDRVAKIEGDPAWFVLDFVNKTEVIDDYTLKIVLNQPVAFYPAVLAVPTYFPIPPDKYPADEISSDNTAGSVGPYKITKWVRDQVLILEANPYYYGEKPKTPKVIVKFYKDATTLRLALESGEIDMAWRTLNPTDIKDLMNKPDIQVIEGKGSFIRYIVFNTKIKPFDNKKVRQALAAALDRNAIAQRVFLGTVDPLYSLVPMGMWSHIDAFKEKYGEANLELAKKLLKEAGYSETNKLKVELWYTPSHYGDTEADVAALIKEAWEKTGMVEVTVKSAEWSTYLELTRKGQLPVTLYGWYPDYIDPDNYLFPFLHTGSNRWLGEPYSNPELDKILEKAQVSLDHKDREQLYKQAQQILAEDAPIVPIFQGKLYVAAKKNVHGIVLDPLMLLRYYLIYKEAGS
ncbi:MAG: peptide ABC transporter substrate-binding protein [Candidatus Korarchaeota archaeon]|nr:peptide ABC transporter substrate-binding protein [Candidatus Korarchaeota archaeon]